MPELKFKTENLEIMYSTYGYYIIFIYFVTNI